MIEKFEPTFPELAKQIDELRKEKWKEAVHVKKRLLVVCGFMSLYEDDVVGKCSECGRDVSVRGWLKKEAEKHAVPIICIICAVEKMDSEATIL